MIGVVALLGMAAPAQADVRYAEPGGDGPAATCPETNPCSLSVAAEDPAVGDGDEILLLPGTHDVQGIPGDGLDSIDAISIRPLDPASRPVITAANANVVVSLRATGASVTDVEIRSTGGDGTALFLAGATAERVRAQAQSGGGCGVIEGAVIRDSLCIDSGGGPGAFTNTSDPSEDQSGALSNVTAISTVAGSDAYGLFAGAFDTASIATLTVHNTIAVGAAGSPDAYADRNAGATSATIELTNSNFDLVGQEGGGSVTAPGSGENQTAPPVFAAPAAGDFHEAAGSPTINAGSPDFLYFGPLDLDRAPRTQGPAPDIGAYEFDQIPPETILTKAPKKKVRTRKKRKRARFAFESNEAGASFVCAIDGKPEQPCAGTFSKKVRRGKHSFEVVAIDPSGNVDPSAITYSWRVKRKR